MTSCESIWTQIAHKFQELSELRFDYEQEIVVTQLDMSDTSDRPFIRLYGR